MHRLLAIFAVTTVRFLLGIVVIIVIMTASSVCFWLSYDRSEVSLRNQIVSQQQITVLTYEAMQHRDLHDQFLTEQKRLVDYKAEYDTLRQTWIGRMLLGNRPVIDIKTITSVQTQAAFDLESKNERKVPDDGSR